MKDIKITELKKYLVDITVEDLRGDIVELFKLFPDVKEYYAVKLKPEAEGELLKKYGKIIKNEFYPERGFGKLRYSVMKKALEDFRKISNNPQNIAELMILHVEFGVEFSNDYGDIDKKFYNNIAGMYGKFLTFIFEENIEQVFKERAEKVIDDAGGIGWGFSEELCNLYYSYFED